MVKKRDVDVEKIKELYSQGLIGREIASQLGCSVSLVQTRLAKAGIKMRPSNERRKVEISKEVLEDLYWNQEKHPVEIGKIYGLTKTSVVKKMRGYGIPLRTKSEARKGKMNPLYGVGHTIETKNKMSKMFLDGRRKVSLTNVYGNPTEYKGIIYRSSWEAGVAFYFDGMGVSHLYEHNSFPYTDQKGIKRTYTPDFFLPNGLGSDPNPVYVEVKGRFSKEDEWKFSQVKGKYAEILLWGRKELLELCIIDAAGKILVGKDVIRKKG